MAYAIVCIFGYLVGGARHYGRFMERKRAERTDSQDAADGFARLGPTDEVDDTGTINALTSIAYTESRLRRRRWSLAGAAGLIVITGLVVHFVTEGAVGDFVADALYAVLIFLLLSLFFVRVNGWLIAGIAIALCTAIELFQLTGVPLAMAEAFPPARLVFGTTFIATDLIAYILGIVVAAVVTTWRRLD